MKTFTYTLNPLVFHIESECATPEEALGEELKCGTSEETMLLEYLHKNIEDYPTLEGSVECLFYEESND
jgi:hypothetical protein